MKSLICLSSLLSEWISFVVIPVLLAHYPNSFWLYDRGLFCVFRHLTYYVTIMKTMAMTIGTYIRPGVRECLEDRREQFACPVQVGPFTGQCLIDFSLQQFFVVYLIITSVAQPVQWYFSSNISSSIPLQWPVGLSDTYQCRDQANKVHNCKIDKA